jgi:hypothetical protein
MVEGNGVSVARRQWVSADGAEFLLDDVGLLTISAERVLSFDGVRAVADGVVVGFGQVWECVCRTEARVGC